MSLLSITHVGLTESLLLCALRYVYQVVVPKQLADKDLLNVFQSKEMVVLPPWDPMVCYILFQGIFFLWFGVYRVPLHVTTTIDTFLVEGTRGSFLFVYFRYC